MRLPTDVRTRFLALGLTALLAACGRGGSEPANFAMVSDNTAEPAGVGPSADYPVLVGEPYNIGETLYTPVDTMNYDEVGYLALDAGAQGVSVAHKTLPYPSYVEITALENGKTILARVERRGPMTNDRVAALSPAAVQQLDSADGGAIRIRRVNPPETERANLRMGEAAPMRMDMPKSLIAVLKRKLPAKGSVSLSSTGPQVAASAPNAASKPKLPAAASQTNVKPKAAELPALASASARPITVAQSPMPKVAPAAKLPMTKVAATPRPKRAFADAFSEERKAVTAYPLPPIGAKFTASTRAPVRVSQIATPPARTARSAPTPMPKPAVRPAADAKDGFVIQAAAFSVKANAERAANSIDGFVQQSGKYFRVRKGPFANRGQAEAALAKVRAAGYSDAKVFTAG